MLWSWAKHDGDEVENEHGRLRNNSVDFVTSTTEHRVCGKRRTCEES